MDARPARTAPRRGCPSREQPLGEPGAAHRARLPRRVRRATFRFAVAVVPGRWTSRISCRRKRHLPTIFVSAVTCTRVHLAHARQNPLQGALCRPHTVGGMRVASERPVISATRLKVSVPASALVRGAGSAGVLDAGGRADPGVERQHGKQHRRLPRPVRNGVRQPVDDDRRRQRHEPHDHGSDGGHHVLLPGGRLQHERPDERPVRPGVLHGAGAARTSPTITSVSPSERAGHRRHADHDQRHQLRHQRDDTGGWHPGDGHHAGELHATPGDDAGRQLPALATCRSSTATARRRRRAGAFTYTATPTTPTLTSVSPTSGPTTRRHDHHADRHELRLRGHGPRRRRGRDQRGVLQRDADHGADAGRHAPARATSRSPTRTASRRRAREPSPTRRRPRRGRRRGPCRREADRRRVAP